MFQRTKTSVSLALAGLLMASALGGVFVPATQAKGSKTWRNGAIAGGVLGGYGLLKHNRGATIAGAGVAGYSLYRYNKTRKHEKRMARYRSTRRYGYYRRAR